MSLSVFKVSYFMPNKEFQTNKLKAPFMYNTTRNHYRLLCLTLNILKWIIYVSD